MTEPSPERMVINILLENRWMPDGETAAATARVPMGAAAHGGAERKSGGRMRFAHPEGKVKVTVGAYTTYFYIPQNGVDFEDWPSMRFDTKHISAIKEYAEGGWKELAEE